MATLISRGGGNEVGGSCHDYDGKVGFDCGIRPAKNVFDQARIIRGGELFVQQTRDVKHQLPDLDAVSHINDWIISHGHLDHIGALPALTRRNPNVRGHGTPETLFLGKYLWRDTLKIAKNEGIFPPFDEDDIERTIEQFKVIDVGSTLSERIPLSGNLSFAAVRNEHLLGSMSTVIYENNEPVGLYTGDICLHDIPQRTVPRMPKLDIRGLRWMMVDSTRLAVKSYSRKKEEERFKKETIKALKEGKSIRVLSFAIGRTQETWEIMREACEEAKLKVPIWIDGPAGCMISEFYLANGRVNPDIRKSLIVPKDRDRQEAFDLRWKILKGGQSIVLVPSAMQFGGMSQFWVKHSIQNPNHLLVWPGFVDPCSPEALVLFQSKVGDVLEFKWADRIWSMVRYCDIAQFDLTGHLSGTDVLELVERHQPDKTITVHGDSDKMDAYIAAHPDKGFVKGQNGVAIEI